MHPLLKDICHNPLLWLLVFVPISAALHYSQAGEIWVFVASCVAIIPLAGLMGRATENLSETMGAGIGGLMNATFGNAAELIIALAALRKGPEMYPLVQASLTGSIIGNILLVLGLALVAGGATRSRWPARMLPFASSLFHAFRSRWLTPYSSAISESVSPHRTR